MVVFEFKPKPDITAYELAQLFVVLEIFVDEAVYRKIPAEVQRHFATFNGDMNGKYVMSGATP